MLNTTFRFPHLFNSSLNSTTMDPTTTVPPPSPPPQNPHTPTDAFGEPSTGRNMNNFRSLVFNLAGRLLPAHHQPLVERRFDEIIPHELLVPDHPPYADMILTALWELKSEGGSSEEDVSNFIKKEYHELPWAHATILNRHLKDLCKQGKITMTHDRCYMLGSSTTKPESSSSPVSSSYSTSSTSVYSSSSTSSSCSSLSWDGGGGLNRRRTRNNGKKKTGKKMVRVRSRGRGRGRGRGRCRSRSRIDVEDESEDTSLEVEHQNEATSLEINDQNEATSLEVEDQNEATSLEIKDQNEATSLEIKDQNEATSLEINDQNEATSLEIKDQNEATSLEINDQNEATSLEIKDQNEVTSLEFEDQNEITNLKVEVQNEITNLKVEVQNEVTGTGAEDHNKVTSLEVEDHNEVTSLEVEVQNEVTSLEVEVQNEVTSLEIENQNKVTSLEVEDHCKVTSLEIEYTNKVTSLEVEDHCKVTSLEVEDHNKVTSLEVEDHCKVGLEVEGSSFKDGNGLCDENAKVSAEENLPCEQNNKEKLRPEKMYNVTWIGRRVRRLEDEVDIVSEPSDDEVTMLEADAGVAKVVENVVQMDSNRPDENEQCDIERGTLEEEQVTATSVEKQHADTFEEQVETKKQPLDDDDVIEGPIDPQDQCAEKTEEPLQSCKQDEVENVETKSTKYEEHQTQTDHKEIVLSNVQQEPFVEIIERQTETSKKDSLEENTASSGSATEGPRRTRQGLRSSSKTRIKTEEPLQSCKQDDLENVETKSTKHEEHHTEANKKEIVLSNVQQEQIVEIMEQETEISKKDSLQENMTSSDSTTEGPRHTRQGLRSSKKKEDAAPSSHTKTQSELVTPVRRSLRSNKTSSEPAVISEAPDNSKEEEVTYLGRTRASKRKPGTAEAEQVSSTRKTRRTGL